jgi:hypothetical protein
LGDPLEVEFVKPGSFANSFLPHVFGVPKWFLQIRALPKPTPVHYSGGTVLLFLVLEDLFREPSCDYYDLGDFAAHKEYLATDSYLETDAWLFRRLPYAGLVRSAYRVCNLTTKFGGAVLKRLGLKERIVRLMCRID